jgi:hypothetical protein
MGVLLSAAGLPAGDLLPSAGPTAIGSQMVTLEQIFNRINLGAAAGKMTTFTEPSSGPTAGTMHTLDEIYDLAGQRAPVARTGQTLTEPISAPSFSDGDLQKGVAWPSPRFTIQGVTVTDNLTGLMWTKDGNLAGVPKNWFDALTYCNNLDHGGYTDWRLPNARELQSLIDYGRLNPALPPGHPFTNVQPAPYWSSTIFAESPDGAWIAFMDRGFLLPGGSRSDPDPLNVFSVWPVRGGQ